MEKRYQIFISSTFLDLLDERQAVLKAVLELDHMPAGMELFPATDESAWQLITDVIDSSDYYVLIIGGRYGSLDEAGIGYTEKEYTYALISKKPIIALIHENPGKLPREKTETDTAAWEKLKAFRARVEKKHTCVYWRSVDDLKAKVIIGVTAATKRHPAIGWVRADKVPSEATVSEVLTLRNRIAELEQQAASLTDRPPAGTDDLSQGDDLFEIHLSFSVRPKGGSYLDDLMYTASVWPTWNAIFAAVAPSMMNETSDEDLRTTFNNFLKREAAKTFKGQRQFKEKTLRNFRFEAKDIETCIIQFSALGLIRESDRKRSVKDTGTYWTLTPYGNTLMVQLRAIRREPLIDETEVSGVTVSDDAE